METCAWTQILAPNLRSDQHYLRRQADVMQNGTDAGLVPGGRQNTMGVEADFGGENSQNMYFSDRTPQIKGQIAPPRGQSLER